MRDYNSFKNIESFIEHLMRNDNIVGIVEYGGREYRDISTGGDYDLTIIFREPISHNFTGVHFHIAGIPIDCMLLSIEDFLTDIPANEFLLCHLNCRILFDRNDVTKSILDRIKSTWKAPECLTDFEENTFKFTFQHILDKLESRLHKDELYSRYFIYSSFDWFLECYARIHNLETGKPKVHINYIKDKDPELFNIITQMYNTNDLDLQFEMLKECANNISIPIGGLWNKDEILFHLSPDGINVDEEQINAIKLLFD